MMNGKGNRSGKRSMSKGEVLFSDLGWHIDHKKPVSWFNFKTVTDSEFVECWSLSNLQPLSREENQSKSNRWWNA